MQTVGFIGLGNMGAGIASNIIRAGYPIVVHDTREDVCRQFQARGAHLARSPADVARRAAVIFTSLPGPSEVETVALGASGILEGINAGAIYVDLSTSRPTLIQRIESVFRGKNADVLDAPVSGGKLGAESGNLAVMVGGRREAYEQISPILRSFGDKVFYAGAVGAGSICKLVHNLISHTVRQAIAEGLTLGVKAGVEPRILWECVRRGAVGRIHDLHERLPRTMFRGQFEPASFKLAFLCKDINLATELAEEYAVPLPISRIAAQKAFEAVDRGWGDMDDTVFVRLQEEAAGAEVRVPNIDLARTAAFISTHPDA